MIPGAPPLEVPRELVPWVGWVASDIKTGLCPMVGEVELCVWPTRLELFVSKEGARFSYQVMLERAGDVVLPGSSSIWPEAVFADNQPAIVLSSEGGPVTWLDQGVHELRGEFVWKTAPETLAVPKTVGLVELTVNGEQLPFPRREESGALWLQLGQSAAEGASDRAEIEVFRRIDDGVPLRVTTQIVLRISGRTRELELRGAGLAEGRLIRLTSPLPARVEAGKGLVLHAMAGEHRVTLDAIFPMPPERLVREPAVSPWPEAETWVFVANSPLRQVELTGVPSVDPAQTNLPEEWKSYQAFSVEGGKPVTFVTKRRGEPEPPPNQLELMRHLWLDFDGTGYTVKDALSGTLNRDFRLDLLVAELGHATSHGQDLVITRGKTGRSGIELREPKVQVTAEYRLDGARARLPAVGWHSDMNSLAAIVHLPPGWDVWHVSGPDGATQTWWSKWSLWGFFYVLLLTIAIGRLFGLPAGVLAFGTLVILYGREGAPMASWAFLVALFALLRVIPAGRFRRLMRLCWFGTVLTFAVIAVDYSVDEVRGAFFPTAASASGSRGNYDKNNLLYGMNSVSDSREGNMGAKGDDGVAALAVPAPMQMNEPHADLKARASGSRSKLAVAQKPKAILVDPDAVAQTGPGLPSWLWNSTELSWSGPVRTGEEISLYLVTPLVGKVLGCLRVLGLVALAFLLIRRTPYGFVPPPLPRLLRRFAPAAAALGLLLLPHSASAQPSSELLSELRTRLLRQPACQGCLEVERLDLRIEGRQLIGQAVVHAGKVVDYRVPGPVRSWVPETVTIDETPARAMVLMADGFLHVRLAPGTHRVGLRGPILGNELVMAPGSPPHRVTVESRGWRVDGVREGHVDSTLHFAAEVEGEASLVAIKNQSLPPWLEITRVLELGVTWKLETQVERKSPPGEPVSVRYPLLPGEEVTESNALVDNRELVITLGRDDTSARYRSVLQPSERIELLAAEGRPYSEHWKLRPSTLYAFEFSGLSPFSRIEQDQVAPSFRPWPGERVAVTVTRPPPIPGASRTIEYAEARMTPGQRLLKGELELTIRLSKAHTQPIRLEPGSVVQHLKVNGRDEPLRQSGGVVEVSLQPGRQVVSLGWHQPRPQAFAFTSPRVELGAPAANAKVTVSLPSDRWLLFTWGPSWGPKVLLWSYLALLLGSGWLLQRLPKNPLRVWQWALLGLGLTQVPLVIPLIVAGWFFAMAFRHDLGEVPRWQKNLLQLGLTAFSLTFLGCLGATVYQGLVSNPDMLVSGGDPSEMSFYEDRVAGALPTPTVISLPVVAFRIMNLFWALWLAGSLLGWLKWGWSAFGSGGLWAKAPPRPVPVPAPEPPPQVQP